LLAWDGINVNILRAKKPRPINEKNPFNNTLEFEKSHNFIDA
jgi:hypothetical protein